MDVDFVMLFIAKSKISNKNECTYAPLKSVH